MSPINFKLAIILGFRLERIRARIEQFENMHLGLFINSLRYKDKKEVKKLKKDFINSVANSIKLINKEIDNLNIFVRYLNKSGFVLTPVSKINFTAIKKIIMDHQGHYPQSEGLAGIVQEQMGEGNSPSVLARKHTSLQIRNVILKTKLSLSDFIKSIDSFLGVFDSVNRDSFRPYVQDEIEKAKTAYSVGLFGESILILGRLLENLITEFTLLLKKVRKVSLTRDQILGLDFHNKIEFLHSKNLPIFSDSQFSKLMSVKWDRNTYGHKINSKSKDYRAVIIIGLVAIEFLEKKILKHKQKLKK